MSIYSFSMLPRGESLLYMGTCWEEPLAMLGPTSWLLGIISFT